MSPEPGIYGGRYVDESEIEDARREVAADAFDRVKRVCWNCGFEWDPCYHRADRVDPAWEDRPECPRCDAHPDEEGEVDGPLYSVDGVEYETLQQAVARAARGRLTITELRTGRALDYNGRRR